MVNGKHKKKQCIKEWQHTFYILYIIGVSFLLATKRVLVGKRILPKKRVMPQKSDMYSNRQGVPLGPPRLTFEFGRFAVIFSKETIKN